MKYSFIYFILSWIHMEMVKGINYENKLAVTICNAHKDILKNPKKELASDILPGFRKDNILSLKIKIFNFSRFGFKLRLNMEVNLTP